MNVVENIDYISKCQKDR